MTDVDDTWERAALGALAPSVDEGAAMALFQRERSRRRTARRAAAVGATAALVLVGGVAALVVRDEAGVGVDSGLADSGKDADWHDMGDLPDSRTTGTVVATGSDVFVWGGVGHAPGERMPPAGAGYPPGYKGYTGSPLVNGLRYDVRARRWSPIPDAPVPFLGFEVEAAWTGRELLVWGTDYHALGPTTSRAAGALYDPAKNAWRPMAPQDHVVLGSGAWTGEEFVVVGSPRGGRAVRAAAYDPDTDRWRTLADPPLVNPPSSMGVVAWTGTHVVAAADGMDTVAVGDLRTGTWRRSPPSPLGRRIGMTYAWSGAELLTLGGGTVRPGDDVAERAAGGAAYDPAADSWARLDDAPEVLGGVAVGDDKVAFLTTGTQYSSRTKAWSPFPPPPGGSGPTAPWDGASLWTLRFEDVQPDQPFKPGRLLRYGR